MRFRETYGSSCGKPRPRIIFQVMKVEVVDNIVYDIQCSLSDCGTVSLLQARFRRQIRVQGLTSMNGAAMSCVAEKLCVDSMTIEYHDYNSNEKMKTKSCGSREHDFKTNAI